MAKVIAARCVLLGLPIQQQYDYEHDPSIRTAFFSLRSQTRPRSYQVEAVEAATKEGTLNSGCLLLPCGAGKTLVGVMLMCKVRKPTLVVCAGAVSVEQWRNQILEAASLDPLPTEEQEEELEQQPFANMANMHTISKRPAAAHRLHKTRPARLSGAARIACLTGKQKDEINEDTDVVLTTYSMLVTAHKAMLRKRAQRVLPSMEGNHSILSSQQTPYSQQQRRRKTNIKEKLFAPYGLLILDEVHVIPAEAFRESLGYIDAKGVIGLTATYVREDNKILDLFHLVGPKLFDISMETLVAQGYLAKVNCVEVHTPMTREFGIEYMERCGGNGSAESFTDYNSGSSNSSNDNVPALILLAAANPYKMQCVQELVNRHLENGAKILVFCDHLLLLHEYAKFLNVPVISGATPHRERLMIFSDFQSTQKINVICISRVGDVSVNLPSANVVIQVSSHGGSRRQEAQRLGRILRPKERAANGTMVEAWFYSIISMDTLEMAHAAHRTAFLVDQGYTCRLMEFVPEQSHHHDDDLHDGSSATKINTKHEVKTEAAATSISNHVKIQPLKTEIHKMKTDTHPVGDAVSIKQENMYQNLHNASTIRRNDSNAKINSIDVQSLQYQLMLLSRVVASWEITFQQSSRLRSKKAKLNDVEHDKYGTGHEQEMLYSKDNNNSSTKKKKKKKNTSGNKRKRGANEDEEDDDNDIDDDEEDELMQMYPSSSDSEDNVRRDYHSTSVQNNNENDEEDDDVVEIQPHRGLHVIKREYTDDVQEGLLQNTVALNTLVGVEDGFVYHEL